MKVALVLYGQPRFVDRDDVFWNHMETVIHPYKADVYAQMWHDPDIDPDYGHTSSWALDHEANYKIPDNAPELILERYCPERMSVDRPIFELPEEEVLKVLERRFSGNHYYSRDNMINIISAGTAMSRACSLAGNDYNWYVVARYDAFLRNMPNLYDLDTGKYYLPRLGDFNDLVGIFSSRFMCPNPYYMTPILAKKSVDLAKEIKLPIPELYKMQSVLMSISGSHRTIEKCDVYADVIRN